MSEPKLSKVQEAYIKKMEREKVEREALLHRLKRRNRYFLTGGISAVLGIYFYTMYTVRQETFLDDLDSEIQKKREQEGE